MTVVITPKVKINIFASPSSVTSYSLNMNWSFMGLYK